MFREKISVVSLHRSSTTCSLVTETDELLFIKMQQTTHLSFQFVSTAEILENKWAPQKRKKRKKECTLTNELYRPWSIFFSTDSKSGGESLGGVGVTSVRTGGSGPSGERRDGRLSSVSGFSSGGFTACSKTTEYSSDWRGKISSGCFWSKCAFIHQYPS